MKRPHWRNNETGMENGNAYFNSCWNGRKRAETNVRLFKR